MYTIVEGETDSHVRCNVLKMSIVWALVSIELALQITWSPRDHSYNNELMVTMLRTWQAYQLVGELWFYPHCQLDVMTTDALNLAENISKLHLFANFSW